MLTCMRDMISLQLLPIDITLTFVDTLVRTVAIHKDCIKSCTLIQRDTRPTPIVNCRMTSGKHARGISPAPDHRTEAGLRIDPKVLVFVETTYSQLGRNISELLVYNRIK
uniref:Heparan sulfate-N-deacetylase N-terminal domain-containing protein n=1 Tax=Glossina austeni TaxID=7395 RepID=A0A1A9V3Y1_GLOAU